MFEKQKARQKRKLIESQLIQIDENGREQLTEKGMEVVARRIGALPAGEEFLIELAVLDSHGIAVYAD